MPEHPSSGPTADVSVRVAWADDAEAVARVQVATWPEQYAGLVDPEDVPTGPEAEARAAEVWRASLTSPGDARNRVLVALERNRVVGFVVTAPGTDPDCDPVADGELLELCVAPGERRLGHGSRLLQAAADTMVADRFTRAVSWLRAEDDDRRRFLIEAGWAPDQAHRELEGPGGVRAKQVRLHTALG